MFIIWIIKKHISYSQVEDKTFSKFVVDCSMRAINAKSILSHSNNTI